MRFSTVRRYRYAARAPRPCSRQLAIAGEQRQDGQQRARAQLRPAAAAHELERLHDELDLADAAGAELDVLGQILARDFLRDQRFICRSASNTP